MEYKIVNGVLIASEVLQSNRYLTRLEDLVMSDCEMNIPESAQLLNAGDFRYNITPTSCVDVHKDIYAVQLPDGTIEAIVVDEELMKAITNGIVRCSCEYQDDRIIQIAALVLSMATKNVLNSYRIWTVLMKSKAIPATCCH